ncbi:MAG: class I SAM-dependent methyltransferase [Clostridia bacterium]|nr:class I SAM-dependent methyltransferase [Clostridia bacterium]
MAASYTELPAFYDFLGEHPDYEKMAERIINIYEEKGAKESGLILDLACGTGKLTCALLERGADVIGTDLSPEMLMQARDTCMQKGHSPLLLCQDMRDLDLYGTVDVTVCATNSLNYLENEGELERVFSLVHNFLTPGGLFFFDINSLYKFEKLYGENTYVFENEDVFCVWENQYEAEEGVCDFRLTMFEKERGGRYRRLEEEQSQTYFAEELVEKLLKKAGFELIEKAGDLEGGTVKEESADLFYVCKCVK